jgi:voltage-gated potassium channel
MGLSPLNNFLFLATITLAYGFLYSRMDPKDFGFESPIDPYYFAFTTMSTVGYGDFGPKTDRAKMLVMSQQGILIGELIAILGSLVATKRTKIA